MANEYVNKVIYGTTVLVDLTEDTVTPSALAEGYTAHDKSGAAIVGTATGGSMVIRDEQDSHGGTIRSITAGSVVQGTKTITENGTYDVAAYADASVNVAAPEPELQAKTATPSTSQQVITADSGYDGLSQVTVSAMPSGSATTPTTSITANPSISVNSSTGLITASVSGSKSVTPSVSAGYVSSGTAGTVSVSGSNTSQLTTQAAKTVTPSTSSQTAVAAGRYTTGAVTVAAMPSGTAGTPSATKGTVSNHSVSVTPSVTNATGYITGGTQTGTAVTVSASELVSGTLEVTESGTYDVTNYASADVNVASGGHKVTVRTSKAGYTCRVQLNGTGAALYKDGDETEFSAGDYIKVTAGGSMSGGDIYVNGTHIYGSQDTITFNYMLPPCNVTVETNYSSSGTVRITTEEQIVMFESGEFTPSEDVTEVSVSFSSTHLQPPAAVMVAYVQNSLPAYGTAVYFMYQNTRYLFGGRGNFGEDKYAEGVAGGMYCTSSSGLSSVWHGIQYGASNASSTDSSYTRWWVSETGFKAYLNDSRYFRSGCKYAWKAIWTA